jgi:hypothetical protein
MSRRAGIIQFKINGDIFDVKGEITYSLGLPMRESILGHDGVHGYKELPTVPFCEMELTDSGNLDLAALGAVVDATLTIALANGKTVVFRKAFAANPDGLSVTTEEGVITQRFEAESADEI